MQVVAGVTLACECREDIGDAVQIAGTKSPGGLDPLAKGGVLEPRLTSENTDPQIQIARRQAGELVGDHPLQDGGVGWRAVDGVGTKLLHGPDQMFAATDAEWHDRGAGRFQGGVIGIAAHPETIVEAVHRNVSRAQADGSHRTSSDPRIHGTVALRQGGVHGPAGGAGRAMDAAHGFRGGRQIVAEGRVLFL